MLDAILITVGAAAILFYARHGTVRRARAARRAARDARESALNARWAAHLDALEMAAGGKDQGIQA